MPWRKVKQGRGGGGRVAVFSRWSGGPHGEVRPCSIRLSEPQGGQSDTLPALSISRPRPWREGVGEGRSLHGSLIVLSTLPHPAVLHPASAWKIGSSLVCWGLPKDPKCQGMCLASGTALWVTLCRGLRRLHPPAPQCMWVPGLPTVSGAPGYEAKAGACPQGCCSCQQAGFRPRPGLQLLRLP